MFTSMPNLATSDLPPDLKVFLIAAKDNIELLTGQRGEAGKSDKAILIGEITVAELAALKGGRVTATGQGFYVDGLALASATDHATLAANVQTLANDVELLRRAVNALIKQLKGS